MFKLFLDDVRDPSDDTWHVARTVDDAVAMIEFFGFPREIAFDHDMGVDDNGDLLPTGMDFVNIIQENILDGEWRFPSDFSFSVHSSNPDGAKNIRSKMGNLMKFAPLEAGYFYAPYIPVQVHYCSI